MTEFEVRTAAIEATDGGFTAEASTMGLPVGVFPERITVPAGRAGGRWMRMTINTDREGDVTSVNYGRIGGGQMVVWND